MNALTPPRLSVVIPTCQGEKWLPECLAALQRQTFRDFEIVVVDNSTGDATPRLLAEGFPQVKLVKFDRPLGFARPVNAGWRAATGDLIFLLNDDTVCEPDCLAQLVQGAADHPEASFFAAVMVYHDAPGVINSAGHWVLGNGLVVERGFQQQLAGEYLEPQEVFGACGGAVLYRRELLEQLGGFDENLYIVNEDVDLDYRARVQGARCFYLPAARVRHRVSQSLGSDSPRMLYAYTTTLALYVLKNLPPTLWRRQGGRIALQVWKAAAAVARLSGGRKVLQAAWEVLGLAPRMLRARRQQLPALRQREADLLAWCRPDLRWPPPVESETEGSYLATRRQMLVPALLGLGLVAPWLLAVALLRLSDAWAGLLPPPVGDA